MCDHNKNDAQKRSKKYLAAAKHRRNLGKHGGKQNKADDREHTPKKA